MFNRIIKMSKRQTQALTILSLLVAIEAFLFAALCWSSQFLEVPSFHFFMEGQQTLSIVYSIILFVTVTILGLLVCIFIWGFIIKPEPSEEDIEVKIDILVAKLESLQKSVDTFIAIKEDGNIQRKGRK